MKHGLITALMFLLFAPALPAGEEPPEAPKTPRERYQALVQEYQKASQGFMEDYQKATTDAERSKLFAEKYPKPQSYTGRFLALAESSPDDPAAVDALIWVVRNGQGGRDAARAIDRLARGHAADRRMAEVAPSLVHSASPATERLLRAIIEENPDRAAKGAACLALGQLLKQWDDVRGGIADNPGRALAIRAQLAMQGADAATIDRITRGDRDALMKEAEAAFERTVKEFGDVPSGRSTLGKTAETELYEIRNLGIGKTAPEIAGEDIDGASFKLSDYKGKVVLVDFWGDW